MNTVIYTKINRERKKQFQLMTQIVVDEEGKKYVYKKPLNKDAVSHVCRIHDYCLNSSREDIRIANSTIENDCIKMEYIEGKSLCDILMDHIANGDRKEAVSILERYKDFIYGIGKESAIFTPSSSYEEVFGNNYPEGVLAGKSINIDCVLENIICTDSECVVIDYEWFFDFYIPYDYLLYRAVWALYCNYSSYMNELWSFTELCDILGISKGKIDIYARMNDNFNDYVYNGILGYNSIKKKYSKVKTNIIDILYTSKHSACLYYDTGEGFNEKDIIITDYDYSQYHDCKIITLTYDLSFTNDIKALRFDPMIHCGIVKIDSIAADSDQDLSEHLISVNSESVGLENDERLFFSDDPCYVYDVDNDIKSLTVRFYVIPLESSVLDIIVNYRTKLQSLHKNTVTLYYDIGDGFNEADAINNEIEHTEYCGNKEITLEYNLTGISGIRRLRFDPMSTGGIVKIISITADDSISLEGQREYISPDSIALEDGYTLFSTDDPQIVYKVDSDIKRLSIRFSITPIDNEILGKIRDREWKKHIRFKR